MTSVPYPTIDGNPISGGELQANLDYLCSVIDALKAANLDPSAGIDSKQLSKRFSLYSQVVWQLPYVNGTDADADGITEVQADMYEAPVVYQTVYKEHVLLDAGQEAAIVAIEVDVRNVDLTGGFFPALKVWVNSTLLNGAVIELKNDDAQYKVEAGAAPVQAPLFPLANGDIIKVEWGSTGAGCFAAGVTVILKRKTELH